MLCSWALFSAAAISSLVGIVFLRYAKDNPPTVQNGTVKFYHDFLGDEVEVDADLVVLSTPLIPNEDALDVARALGISADSDDFFLESNIKMKPVDSSREGVYISGTCRWPCDIDEAVGLGVVGPQYRRVGEARAAAGLDELAPAARFAQLQPLRRQSAVRQLEGARVGHGAAGETDLKDVADLDAAVIANRDVS